MNAAQTAYVRRAPDTVIMQYGEPEIRPDRYIAPCKREDCQYTAEQIAAFLDGTLAQLQAGSRRLVQDDLRQMRRVEAALRAVRAEIVELDPELDRAELRAAKRREAFLADEASFMREEWRLYLATGETWGRYDRAVELNEYRNSLIGELPPAEDGGFIATRDDRQRIDRAVLNYVFAKYAKGVIDNDDQLKAWCARRPECTRKLRAAAVQQAKAGLEVDVWGL